MDREVKKLSGRVVEVKQEERNGVSVGIVKGHIATFDLDRTDDQFVKGAFIESIQEHREKNRPIRLKDHHFKTIGGFPIDTVIEDEKGLFGIGEINLEVQEGREAFALAKQGVISDFSIGFSVVEDKVVDGVRQITKAVIWEGSVVDEPANTKANITEVKTLTMDELKEMDVRDLEKHLKATFSKSVAKYIVSVVKAAELPEDSTPDPELKHSGEEINEYWERQKILSLLKGIKKDL